MTTRAPAWFEQKYVDGAIHVLQTDGYLLQGTTMPPVEQKGNSVTWKIAGSGEATPMSGAVEERPVLNADRQTVTATTTDYEANEWINRTDLAKMSQNEQQIAQQTCGYAMGRLFDKLILSELDAQAGAITNIGDGSTAVSIVNMLDAQAKILAQGVMGSPRLVCALPYGLMAQLLLYREFANSQWVGDELPMRKKMGARTFQGVDYIPCPDSYFAVPSADQVDAYVWMPNVVGFFSPLNLESRVDYVPTKKAYFAGNTVSAVAKTLLPGGARRLRFATNVALTRPDAPVA